jgi:hypothetical protein
VDVTKPHKSLWVVDGGINMATQDEDISPENDMGCHAIGGGCARKKEIKPFVLDWEAEKL